MEQEPKVVGRFHIGERLAWVAHALTLGMSCGRDMVPGIPHFPPTTRISLGLRRTYEFQRTLGRMHVAELRTRTLHWQRRSWGSQQARCLQLVLQNMRQESYRQRIISSTTLLGQQQHHLRQVR
jgi:hypothetical protein